MSTYTNRLASFSAWPHASPTPQDLARAGFSHVPTNEHPDNTICNICLHNLYNWQPNEDPSIELRILHPRCSKLWKPERAFKNPLPSELGFLDLSLSLQHDFTDLCLFQDVNTFCDRIKQFRFTESDILALLPSCLRGEALAWFRKSKHQDLAVCIRDMRAKFAQAPPKAPQAPPEGPPEAPQAPPEAPPRAPDYHNCKLCNASFSSMARLIRHTQENICNKPSCRHCETVFSSKNQLHRHLREECRKQTHRSSSKSSSRSSSRSSSTWPSQSSTACSSTCSPISSPAPSPASLPHPRDRAISPPPPNYLTVADLSARFAKPPYLNIDDLFRIFKPSSTAKSSPNHQIRLSTRITITLDDPFIRLFISKKSMGSTQKWELGLATSYHQITQAQCSPPRSTCKRCRSPLPVNINKRQAIPNLS